MNYSELNLREPEVEKTSIKLNSGVDLAVRTYLPIDDKAALITWAIDLSLDDKTGCISPVRFEVCFALGVVKWYTDIDFEGEATLSEIYDLFEQNDVINQVMGAIPASEIDFVKALAQDTAEDIVRYNNSFAGMITAMGDNAGEMDEQIKALVKDISEAKGLETLSVIKDVVGTD